MKDVDITHSQVTIVVEIDGEVHLVGMEKDEYLLVTDIVKRYVKTVVPTNKTQLELNQFFGLDQNRT